MDLALELYYISSVLELDDKKKFIAPTLDLIKNTKDVIWRIYKIACDLQDEDLKGALIYRLNEGNSQALNFLLWKEGEKNIIRETLRAIDEENFKDLLRVHNKQKHHADSQNKAEYLTQKILFEICREYCQANYADQGVKSKFTLIIY